MTYREKLIKLLCESVQTDRCVANCNYPHCNMVQALCDHLIANGVTFATDNNVGHKEEIDFDYSAED